MKKTFLFIVSCIVFSSCYTVKPIGQVMDTYMGASEHTIIMNLGPPTGTVSDGAGGKILTYSSSQAVTTYRPNAYYNQYNPYDYKSSSNTYTVSNYMEFYIDKYDKVYRWRTNYPDQKGELNKKKTNAAIISSIVLIILISIGASSGS